MGLVRKIYYVAEAAFAAAIFVAGVGVLTALVRSMGAKSSDIAAWVQALGSVGAIAGSVGIVRWQIDQAETRKLQYLALGIRAIFSHAQLPVSALIDELEAWQDYIGGIDVLPLQDIIEVLNRFPLHELTNDQLISGALSLQIRLRRMMDTPKVIERANKHLRRPDQFIGHGRGTLEALKVYGDACTEFAEKVGQRRY